MTCALPERITLCDSRCNLCNGVPHRERDCQLTLCRVQSPAGQPLRAAQLDLHHFPRPLVPAQRTLPAAGKRHRFLEDVNE